MLSLNRINNKGFTFLELITIVAILSVLAAISLQQFEQYKANAGNVTAESDLRNAISAQEVNFLYIHACASCSDALDCENNLPGFVASKRSDGSSSMTIFEFSSSSEQDFIGTARHISGHVAYTFDNSIGSFQAG